ncbi:MAG: type II toxin-antitoxin system antitoxin SocA domain-containing protein [Candidatus Absconditabacterales bacterium]
MDKNKQFLLYILSKLHKTNITTIVKMAYFCDLSSVKGVNNQITSYEYIRFYYGPYSEEIKHDIDSLIETKLINLHVYETGDGKDFYEYEYINKEIDFNLLSQKETSLMDEIILDLSKLNARQLGLLSYETAPMKILNATPGGNEHLGQVLNLHAV